MLQCQRASGGGRRRALASKTELRIHKASRDARGRERDRETDTYTQRKKREREKERERERKRENRTEK